MKNEALTKICRWPFKTVGWLLVLSVMIQGCKVWQHESHLEGLSAPDVPRTQGRYWIRVLSADSLSSTKTWEKCLAVYEQRMPSVFSANGTPVFIELEFDSQCVQSAGLYLLNGLLSTCTAYVIPLCKEDHEMRYRVRTSFNVRQKDAKTFSVASTKRSYEGLLAAFAPMPSVPDSRFVHSRMDGGFCREEYAAAFGANQGAGSLCETFNGEADAIVHGVACMLQQFENEWRNAKKSRKIGD